VAALRWTVLLCLLAALLAAPAARAADPTTIIRDCEDDGRLQGSYSPGDLRNARQNLPTDIDEYSDCRDVLARAAAAAVTAGGARGAGGDGGTSAGGSGAGGSGTGGGDSGASDGSGATGGLGGAGGAVGSSGGLVTPTTPQDAQVLADAAASGPPDAIQVRGRPVVPGTSGFAAGAARNALPTSLVLVLALLAAAALLTVALPVRRRVLRRRGA
jgi:hypothetical protein